MDNPLIIGLTGIIGSGKSTVASLLEARGGIVIDADSIARAVVNKGEPALHEIRKHFGETVINADGELDRARLGSIVFSDGQEKKVLEQITHPRIRARYLQELEQAKARNPPFVVYAVPLLFESGFSYEELDIVIVVAAPKETCVDRVMARDGLSRDEAEKRFNSQLSLEEKIKRANYTIWNDGEEQDLPTKVDQFITWLNTSKRFRQIPPP